MSKKKIANKTPRQIVYEKALEWAEQNLVKIKVKAGDYDGPQKCQHVARHRAEFDNTIMPIVIVALAFVPKSGVNVHFLNKNLEDNFIDHTLGYLSQRNTYYLHRELHLDDIKDAIMNNVLMQYKEKILSILFTPQELKTHRITTEHL